MAKTKLSTSTLDTRDASLLAEYVKNQEKRNALHKEENELLAKGGKLTTEQLDDYKKLVVEAGRLHKIAKSLDDTNADILKSADEQVDSWSSLSGIYKGHKESLNQIALKTLELKGISESIAKNTKLDSEQRGIALQKLTVFSDELSSISSKTSQLAGLTAEDVDKRAVLKARIGDELKLLEQQKQYLIKSGKLEGEAVTNLTNKIQAKKDELKQADELSSQYKLQKEVQEELRENLEGFHKTIFKVKGAVSMLFSGWRGASSLILLATGELAEKYHEVGREMGFGLSQANEFKTQILLANLLNEQSAEAVKELGRELGNINEVTYGMAADTAMLAYNMNLSGEQAAFLSHAFGELQGKSWDSGQNMLKFTKELSLANGIMPNETMTEIANNTEFFAKFSKDGGKNIAEAAVAASKLGVGLKTAEEISDHLLDYQSSVQDEMEASVLLGRDLNLSKARELAYNGDIEGSMKAALNAAGGINKFNEMDYYQRQAVAKALGVSVGELQKMAAHEEALNGMRGIGEQIYSRTAEILHTITDSTMGKGLKVLGGWILAGAQFGSQIALINGYMPGLLKPFTILGDFIGAAIKKFIVFIGLQKSLDASKAASGAAALGANLIPFTPPTGIGKKARFMKNAAGKVAQTAAETAATTTATATTSVATAATEGSKNAAKTGGFFKSLNPMNMLAAAGAMLIAAGAIWVLAQSLTVFNNVDWSSLGKAGLAILGLIGTMLLLNAASEAIVTGAAVLVLASVGFMIFGAAIGMIGIGIKEFADGISSLGDGLGLVSQYIGGLISMIPQINQLADAFISLAESLAALGVASIFAGPLLKNVNLNINNTGSGGAAAETDQKLLEEIIGLRTDLNSGKIAVFIDGKKVNRELAVAERRNK